RLVGAGAEVVRVAPDAAGVAPAEVLEDLAGRGVNEVLVEAGPRLAGSLLALGLVDELVIYQAPHIMGSETLRMFRTPGWTALSQRAALEVQDVRNVGRDLKITAVPRDRN
ncbi:MAG: dihydrofolate reductase family protein, partial [Woeseiaceae bacterium]|nr:dihydrofolate reductase family protein [Woeseiaceae bacterium]